MQNPEYRTIGKYQGPGESYREIRKRSLEHTKETKNTSPCQIRMGYCCTPGVVVSLEESQEIVQAANKGKISSEVLRKVKENLDNPDRQMCPFLNENQSCMIYEQRPLECIVFGRGALLATDEGRKKLIEIQNGEREDGLTEPDVYPRLCEDCNAQRNPHTTYSSALVEDTLAAIIYHQLQPALSNLDYVAETLVRETPTPFYPNKRNERMLREAYLKDANARRENGKE